LVARLFRDLHSDSETSFKISESHSVAMLPSML
jgi:hypothetical protein